MEQLIKGITTAGLHYVRPIDWAGIWGKDGKLASGNTLFKSENESECDEYIAKFDALKEKQERDKGCTGCKNYNNGYSEPCNHCSRCRTDEYKEV